MSTIGKQNSGHPDSGPFRALLVSAPWALFHRPSIQLAILRNYLQAEGGYPVENRHLYLNIARKIGIERYSRIGRSGWAGDALFAPLLFPEKRPEAARLFHSELQRDSKGPVPDFDTLVADIEACCSDWLANIELEAFSVVGFSVCFSQLTASLYLASRIQDTADVATVFGGSSCAGSAGMSLIEQFEQIDYLIDGEGEKPLLELCRYLSGERTTIPDQVRTRHRDEYGPRIPDIKPLDDLPVPDFKPYLEEVHRLFDNLPFMPILPVEFSRGCMWNRCTFCNLNLQWHGYRHKSSARMIAEIQELSTANESLNFAFTDNMLPNRELDYFFRAAAESGQDLSFFGEIRAKTTPEQLSHYRRGGLKSVQVGIESLSAPLLARMQKGTTVMDNIAVMKYCCAADILLQGNIIIEFPATTPEEIAETLENLDFVFPFAPLDTAAFFLGCGSPIHCRTSDFEIRAVTVHPKNRMLFPKAFQSGHLIADYRGDKQVQKKRWKPVRQKMQAWQDFHMARSAQSGPALSYRDGGSYLFVQQELPGQEPLLHRLRGLSRKIYLYCDQPKTIDEICDSFPRQSRDAIETFIGQLCGKRLMFRENNRALSLAVRSTQVHISE